MKTKLVLKLIAAGFVLNLMLPLFVMAQTAPADPNIVLDAQKLADASKSKALCEGTFRTEVLTATQQNFSTIFVVTANRTGTTTQCMIVPQNLAINTSTTGAVVQPTGSANIQALIAQGKGLSAKDIATAYNQDLADQTQAAGASKIVGLILNAVLTSVNAFILWVTALVGTIFTTALDWILKSSMPDAVTVGWTIVRDICNMLFILVLIVIGLSTILRIKEYNEYGHLLGELVLMAILINFSKVIATTLIDFVNILISMFGIHHASDVWSLLYRYVNFSDLGSLPNGWMAGLVQGLSKLLFSFVGLATFLALTGLLVVRIVALYILVILSPLAYALNILPATHHYAKEWWEYFIKNLIWVPVALFVMDIGILLAKSPQFTASDSAFNLIIIMAFFWGAVIAAEHMGAAGGKMIAGYAEKAAHMAWETGDMWLARGANRKGPGFVNTSRRALSYLSAGAAIQGWQQRRHTNEHESYLVASAQRQDTFNRLIGGHKTDYGLKAEQQLVADERKLILTKNSAELMHGMQQSLHAKEGEKAFAYAQALFENYDGNEILSQLPYGTDHEGFQAFIDNEFVPLLGKQKAYRLAYDLSRRAEDVGHMNFARAYEARVKNGKVEYDKNTNAGMNVITEMAKANPQQMDRNTNRLGRGFVEVDIDGKRYNLGITDWGRRSRGGVDAQASGRTFNLNAGSNYMFTDSTQALQDNKALWVTLANRISGMTDDTIEQQKELIGSVGYHAIIDDNGKMLRYTDKDQDVIDGKKKVGMIKYEADTAEQIKTRVYSVDQAYGFLRDRKFSTSDLAEAKDLVSKLLDHVNGIQNKDARDKELLAELITAKEKAKK